jgi:RimJ/RimL family protein N-acetyltransferase
MTAPTPSPATSSVSNPSHDAVRILALRDAPERLEEAAEYFSTKWGIARIVYEDSIAHSFADTTDSPLPRWYLLLKGERVIGSYGLISNDFTSRSDIWPWLCALYIEPEERGHAYGALLLAHGRSEAARLGFPKVYLATDHGGYYEKYGWRFLGTCYGSGGEPARLYETNSLGKGGESVATAIDSVAEPAPLILSTDRLLLRPFTDSDFDAVHRYAGNLANTLMTAWGPNTEEQTRGFMRSAQAQVRQSPRRDFDFAVERKDTGELIGGVGIFVDESGAQAEIGWTLRLDQHRNGFATEAARELLRFGFETLAQNRIWATCRADNTGSFRVMERCGMRHEGLLRQSRPGRPCDPLPWYDGLLYAVLREEWRL